MATIFSAQLNAWAKKSTDRMTAIFQESAQRVIEQAQTPGPSVANPGTAAGGRMPIDTGFLRASMAVSFDGMPGGPSRGDPKSAYSYDNSEVTLVLARFKAGMTIYGGWTAEYAPFAEERYAFMRGAAQNWQSIVTTVTQEAQERFP